MTNEEFLSHPASQSAVSGVSTWRASFNAMVAHNREMRAMVSANKDRDPGMAEHLIRLLDQKLAILAEMIGATERMAEILLSAGQIAEDPVEELRAAMRAIHENLGILESLNKESILAIPGSSQPKGMVH